MCDSNVFTHILYFCVCLSSSLFLFSVQWSTVGGEGWFDLLPATWWPDDVGGPTVKQPHRHRSKAVAVQTVSMMIPFNPEVTIRNSNILVLVAKSPDKVSL